MNHNTRNLLVVKHIPLHLLYLEISIECELRRHKQKFEDLGKILRYHDFDMQHNQNLQDHGNIHLMDIHVRLSTSCEFVKVKETLYSI